MSAFSKGERVSVSPLLLPAFLGALFEALASGLVVRLPARSRRLLLQRVPLLREGGLGFRAGRGPLEGLRRLALPAFGVSRASYVAVRGKGDPNEEDGSYRRAIGVLYSVAYTLKMSYKTDYRIEGFYEYVVPPLEGFWWQEGAAEIDCGDKSAFCWISAIRLPDFITEKDLAWAVETATRKKKLDCSKAELLTVDEGFCVQVVHVGPFDDEPAAVAAMNRFVEENGYENDFSSNRLHHEIYLSDARRVAPEKWKTIIRHPIKRA